MEDKLLVLRCKRGSREALTRIYQKYKADLLLLSMALLNDSSAAEDVVHDVFMSFVNGLDTFRLTGSLKGYLLTCAANCAKNWNRAQRRRLKLSSRPDGHPCSEGDEPFDSLVCNEELSRLATALAELPFEQRRTIMLRLHGSLTFGAIAQSEGLPADTVKSRYRYGLEKLRFLLNSEAVK
jgi:RNA polymerase sigma-70 factor (ECF subfamily)